MSLQNNLANPFTQRPAYTRHFKAVRKTGVNKVVFRQRMYLRLILQSPERLREDDAIVILFERAPRGSTRIIYALTATGAAQQGAPRHGWCGLTHSIFLNRLWIEHASTNCAFTSEILTRSCFMVSRSRIVTVSSVRVW